MPAMDVRIVRRGDPPPWEADASKVEIIHTTVDWKVAVLEGGMTSGAPSIMLRLDLDNLLVMSENSLAQIVALVLIARGAFPEAFAGTPLAIPESGPAGFSSSGVFEFQREADGSLPFDSMIRQALGAASLCWSEGTRVTAGPTVHRGPVFDSEQCNAIADAVIVETGKVLVLCRPERAGLLSEISDEDADEYARLIGTENLAKAALHAIRNEQYWFGRAAAAEDTTRSDASMVQAVARVLTDQGYGTTKAECDAATVLQALRDEGVAR